MKIAIDAKKLLSLLSLSADKDVRYYLNGVCLEYFAGKGYRLIATDGHVLGVWDCQGQDEDAVPQTADFRIIIPNDAVKSLKKHKGATVMLESLPDGRYLLGETAFAAIAGVFPDYRRVIPASCTGNYTPCDSRLASLFQDVYETAHGKKNDKYKVCVAYNGIPGTNGDLVAQGCLITLDGHDDFVGVLMPCRMDEARKNSPFAL